METIRWVEGGGEPYKPARWELAVINLALDVYAAKLHREGAYYKTTDMVYALYDRISGALKDK